MALLLWNSNSLRNKTHYLELLIQTHDPLIVVITETHLDPSVSNTELRLHDFQIARRDRPSKGGGVLVAVKNLKGINVYSTFVDPTEELLAIRLSLFGLNICVVAYYRPPTSSSLRSLYDFFERSADCNFLLLGDFNFPDIQWGNNTLCPSRQLSRDFLHFTQESGLSQVIDFPTHVKGNTLDLLFTNLDPHPCLIDGDTGLSDHSALTFNISGFLPNHASPSRSRPPKFILNFGKADLTNISTQLAVMNSQLVKMNECSTNQLWDFFKNKIIEIASANIPSIKLRSKKTWLTRETRTIIGKRRRFFHTYRAFPTPRNLDQLNLISRLAKKLTRRDYTKYIDTHITDSLHSGNSKPLFQLIARSRKGVKDSGVAQLHDCSTDSAITQKFADMFKSVFTVDNGCLPQVTGQPVPPQDDIEVSEAGLLTQLQSLNHCKGAGPDKLSPGILKCFAPHIAPSLTHIFSHSINTGCVPDDWRKANVVPVYKKGDRKDALNYRPISLTCISSKLIEHIIAHQMRLFLDNNNLLSVCQHGFRKKHSCESQLIHTLTDLAMFNNTSSQVDVIILDFSKAFDTVSHTKLIHKLRAFGFNSKLVCWIESWLDGRSFKVVVNGCSSQPTRVTSGVPQGSVLGPLLFLLYINDLPNKISCAHTSIRLFADDAILYRPIHLPSDNLALQQQFSSVTKWAEDWQLRFNVTKCTSTSMLPVKSQYIYHLQGAPLVCTHEFTYLGVKVSSSLSFDAHIRQTLQKASATLYMLMRALKKASPKAKRTSYFSICLPLLEYASEVWNPSLAYQIANFERINRKAFRWAYSYKKFDSISKEMERAGWPTLLSRRVSKDKKTLDKILSNQLAVDYARFTQHNNAYNTRGGNIRLNINSEPMKHSFFNRTVNF